MEKNQNLKIDNNNLRYKTCIKCGEILPISQFYKSSKYVQSYCKNCKSELNKQWRQSNKHKTCDYQKKYMQQFTGKYIYSIHDITGEVVYIGSTTNIMNRSSHHTSCYSNISDYMSQNRWLAIKYIKLSDDITENELRYLENEFILNYEPKLNKQSACVEFNFIEGDRLAYLMRLSDDLIYDYNHSSLIWKVNKHIDRNLTEGLDDWLCMGM